MRPDANTKYLNLYEPNSNKRWYTTPSTGLQLFFWHPPAGLYSRKWPFLSEARIKIGRRLWLRPSKGKKKREKINGYECLFACLDYQYRRYLLKNY